MRPLKASKKSGKHNWNEVTSAYWVECLSPFMASAMKNY